MLPALPIELWDAIVGFIDDRDTLCALCTANSVLCSLAQKYPYHAVTFTYNTRHLHMIKFFLVLAHKPHLAGLVRQFNMQPKYSSLVSTPSNRLAYARALVRAIRSMERLNGLNIMDDMNICRVGWINIGLHCHSLTSLRLCICQPRDSEFLERNLNLEDLVINLGCPSILGDLTGVLRRLSDMPKKALSHLKRLQAEFQVAAILVPHRMIVDLHIPLFPQHMDGYIDESLFLRVLPSCLSRPDL